jgi:Flp pilus assembly protein TadG
MSAMQFSSGSRQKQRGAVAIMVGILLVALIGLLGIVIDLGHLYVRKTELQNAADAAALAGVRALNGAAAGIDTAVTNAITMAAANASDLGKTPVTITAAQIRFSKASPDGPWVDAATARADPAQYTFIKVDTTGIAQETRPTWFMPVVNSALSNTTANGVAVAGAPVCDGLPMFICAPGGAGFTPGQSYFFADQPGAPIGPGNIGYFDPSAPGSPNLIPPGASEMSDIVCAGKTSCIGAGLYSSRTQAAFGKMAQAFNTRFGEFKGSFKDSAEVCRPDTNIKEYPANQVTWLTPPPTDQLAVHWSAVRPGVMPGVPSVNGSYPSAGSAGGTPYTQTTSSYYAAPAGYENTAQAGRRIITMAIGDSAACDGSVNGSGKPVPITGFGRFFMQTKAVGTGGSKGIYVEYIETIQQLKASAPDLKLYR